MVIVHKVKFCIICEKYAIFTNKMLEKSILLQKVEIEVF
ncbi:multidrug transporter MatE [Bacillus wiedmannii]|nr:MULTISPECIES: multidrug transporter MatE [Bacillus cereus group]KAA0783549.1 multidrug transporter MatE [Bacillus sp. BB081]PEI80826.1 multidrug transporter MatE [Bacillus wiedmannii]PEO70606.1 multidrug transporter MatE [Bacillus wiedmannii]PGC24466.1 multidrug transporter MatE [Bacillus wiedmannii]PHB48164.1 multidrug transporter MatE [Bacillus wiedmannii]